MAGARTLRAVPELVVPELPFVANAPTLAWWRAVWSSPMAPEFDPSDLHGLFMLAMLVHGFWSGFGGQDEGVAVLVDDRKALLAEIRLQGQRYGLSPIDRRRLQWEIDRGEEAVAKSAARKAAVPVPAKRRADPRLKAV